MTSTPTTAPRTVREPTLPLIAPILERNIGFRSPWPVRAHLWWLGLTMRARMVSVEMDGSFRAKGWEANDVYYITRVNAP